MSYNVISQKRGVLLPFLFIILSSCFLLPTVPYLLLGFILFCIYVIYLFQITSKKMLVISNGPFSRELILISIYLLINIFGILVYGPLTYYNLILITVSTLSYVLSSYLDWNNKVIRIASWLVVLYIISNIFILITTGFEKGVNGLFNNPNIQGAYTFFLMYFPMLRILESKAVKKRIFWSLILLIMLWLIYLANSRAVYLSITILVLIYALFKFITKTKFIYTVFFTFVLLLALGFIFIYPNLNKYVWFNKLDFFIYNHTGKHIYSGRESIWLDLIDIINLKPFFGYGPNATASRFLNIEFSSHNLFLQTTLQSGWIGLGLLCLILLIIWNRFIIGKFDKKIRLTAAFLVAIVVHQSFELSLTQNNIEIGMLQWLILGIGTSYALRFNYSKRSENEVMKKKE